MLVFILITRLFSQEIYGPMPALDALAPGAIKTQQNLSLDYESWYQKVDHKLGEPKDIEWSLRPHRDLTNSIKDKAINGGLDVQEALKNFNPAHVETELIIRY